MPKIRLAIRTGCSSGLLSLALMISASMAFPRPQSTSGQSAMTIAHLGSEPGRRAAREQAAESVTRAWKSKTGQPLQLIVLDCDARGRAYKSELRQLFPKGVKHLPPTFQAREVYLIEPQGVRRVQYLGRTTHNNFQFALFRELEADEWY